MLPSTSKYIVSIKQTENQTSKQTNQHPLGNSLYPVTHLLSLGSREKTEQPTVLSPTLLLFRTGKKGGLATTQPQYLCHIHQTEHRFQPYSPSEPHTFWLKVNPTPFSKQGQNFEIRIKGEYSEMKTRWFFSRFLCSPEVHSVPSTQGAEFLPESNLDYVWQTVVRTAMAYTNLRNLSIFQISGITDRYQNSGLWACKFLKE